MNRYNTRHPNLPCLSTLLISNPPIIVIDDDVNETKGSNNHVNSKLSPLLSPIDSNYASSVSSNCSSLPSPNLLSVNQSSFLPPLQGDDPPKILKRHPSISSISSTNSNFSTLSSNTKPTLWHVASPSVSPMLSPSAASFSPLPPSFSPASLAASSSPPKQEQQQYQPESPSPPHTPIISQPSLPVPVVVQRSHRPPLPPSTQIVMNEEGQPVLKRRRGRPPNLREPSLEGGWTFLTPTVWDVKNQQQSQNESVSEKPNCSDQQEPTASINNGVIAAFSSSDTEVSLQIPRKKRGRKSKTHIVGNSCFVWKDISATRRSTKAMKLAQKQQQQDTKQDEYPVIAPKIRRIEQAPSTASI
jgi:hypothetical protein